MSAEPLPPKLHLIHTDSGAEVVVMDRAAYKQMRDETQDVIRRMTLENSNLSHDLSQARVELQSVLGSHAQSANRIKELEAQNDRLSSELLQTNKPERVVARPKIIEFSVCYQCGEEETHLESCALVGSVVQTDRRLVV